METVPVVPNPQLSDTSTAHRWESECASRPLKQRPTSDFDEMVSPVLIDRNDLLMEGMQQMDMFATIFSTKLSHFVSPVPDVQVCRVEYPFKKKKKKKKNHYL